MGQKCPANSDGVQSIAREIGDKKGEANGLANISLIHQTRGNYNRALTFIKQAQRIRIEIGDLHGEANNLNDIARIQTKLGEFTKALESYTTNLAIYRNIKHQEMEAQSLYNLGTIYTLLRNYELAHESFTASLSILKIIKFSRGAAYVYSGMGDAYFASAEQIDAEKYYGRAVKIFSGLTNEEEYLWSVLNLSKLQYTIGEFKEARDSLESIVDNPNIQRNYKFESLIYLGACEVEMGEIEPGLARINEGLDSLKSLILYSQTVEAHRIMGEIMLDLGRKDEALQHLEEGQVMADKSWYEGRVTDVQRVD